MSNTELKRRLRISCLIILAVGLCTAALIYQFADDVPDASLGYTVVNGTLYPLATSDSKNYRRDLQRLGGRSALVFDDFYIWLTRLWQGKRLGKTVAWISILVALGIFLFARSLPEGGDTDRPD